MRWIADPAEYRVLRDVASGCVDIDSDRYPTQLVRLIYQDIEAISQEFAKLLQRLMALADEPTCYYMVITPDPEYFWKDHLGRYPVFEMNQSDSPVDYIRYLNEPLGRRGSGDMSTMWDAYVIFSRNLKWFAHGIRSDRDDTGHLWIPAEWIDRAREVYPWLVRRDFGQPLSDAE